MMKKILKNKGLALLLVGVILYGCTMGIFSVLLEDKLSGRRFLERQNNSEFYSIDKNTVDVLAIGSSQILSAFTAPKLYEDYGYATFGLANCQQNSFAAYYWLLEALDRQSPKVILLETAGIARAGSDNDYYKSFTGMSNLSPHKWEAVKEITENIKPNLEWLEFYSPLYKFHSRWDSLDYTDYDFLDGTEKKTYLGSCVNDAKVKDPQPIEVYDVELIENPERDELYYEYLVKFADECEKRGIELVLFKAPRLDWESKDYSVIYNFAEERGLTYFDFNRTELLEEIGLDPTTDMGDASHANILGANKITDYLGKYLSETYDIPDVRGDKHYKDIEQGYQGYANAYADVVLRFTQSFGDSLDYIGGRDLTYVILKKGDVKWDAELQAKLESLGFESDFSEEGNFALVKTGDRVVLDMKSKGKITKYGYFLPGLKNYALSVGGEKTWTRIDGTTKKSERDDCVVMIVYDNSTGRYVQGFTYDKDLIRV